MKAPWTKGAHAYPVAESFADAAEYFKKVRKNYIRMYILEPTSPDLQTEKCAYCRKPMSEGIEKGNRAMYSPKHHRSVVLHYECSWQSLMEDIFGVEPEDRMNARS